MLIYAMIVTFLLGCLVGCLLTVQTALYLSKRAKAKQEADLKARFEENQTILNYDSPKVGPNPFA